MKVIFERDEEKTLFFNMISVFKQFEVEKINPPLSTIDLMIKKLAEIIVNFKFFNMNFSTENLKEKIMFLLGTGNFKIDHLTSIAKQIFPEMEPGFFIEIKIDNLWNYLKENGLQF